MDVDPIWIYPVDCKGYSEFAFYDTVFRDIGPSDLPGYTDVERAQPALRIEYCAPNIRTHAYLLDIDEVRELAAKLNTWLWRHGGEYKWDAAVAPTWTLSGDASKEFTSSSFPQLIFDFTKKPDDGS